MKTREDVYWEQVVETLDLAGGDFAVAEQRLAEAEVAVSDRAEPIEQGARDRSVGKPYSGRTGRPLRAAAVMIGAGLLAAFVCWLIWGGHDSSDTMPYPMAVEVLARPDQPMNHRLSALKVISKRADCGIRTIKLLSVDLDVPYELRMACETALSSLRVVFWATEVPASTGPDDQKLLAAVKGALSVKSPTSERLQQIEQIRAQTAIALFAIANARDLSPDVDEDRQDSLQLLRYQVEKR